MPKLAYTTPPPTLMQELKEVAADAGALATELRKANRLPKDFPISQVQELLEGLQVLPSGTGEGCLKPLEIALSRLPAIRKKYFETEEQSRRSRNREEVPPLTRGMVIDQRLGALISSITTALDEYRALASVEVDNATDTAPSITIDAWSIEIVSAVEAAKSAEQNLLAGAKEVERIAKPSSANADSLKRQMRDASGLLQLARVELHMPEFVPRWFRKIVDGIKDYPALLLTTSKGIQIGVDVARPLVDAWHHFKHGFSRLVLDSIEQALRGLEEVAQKWEAPRTSKRYKEFAPFSIIRDKLGNGQFGPEMVVIPAGEFLMGSASGELNLPEDDRAYENEVSGNGNKRQMRISKSHQSRNVCAICHGAHRNVSIRNHADKSLVLTDWNRANVLLAHDIRQNSHRRVWGYPFNVLVHGTFHFHGVLLSLQFGVLLSLQFGVLLSLQFEVPLVE